LLDLPAREDLMFQKKENTRSSLSSNGEGRGFRRKSVEAGLFFSDLKPFCKEKKLRADLIDIGFGGARISTSTPLKKGTWIHPLTYDVSATDNGSDSLLKSAWNDKAKVVWEKVHEPNKESGKTNYTYGLEFANDRKANFGYWFFKFLPQLVTLFLVLGTLNVLYLKWFNVYYFWYQPVLNVYSLIISVYILSRFIFSAFYRPPEDRGHLPTIAVVIACKNEEESIRRTIDCVYRSDYPSERLEVIAVNDGSTDGTLKEMRQSAKDYPSLRVVNFKENRGKRQGMAVGARMAKGEILVYIDSDSFVRPDGLYKIVQGFYDSTVGAVCGHANVANAKVNALTKMQDVRYFVAFRVIKAAESIFSTVSCCSGCFAAYRREYVMDILDPWLNQKFLGIQATFGDDRSLTNFMLRKYRVIYHAEAVCTTIVPEKYGIFFRQQLRWKKSWIRESFLACLFMWKRHPVAAFFYYSGVLFPIIAPFIVLNAIVLPLLGFWPISYLYVYGAVLMAGLYSLVYLAFFRSSLWIYGISFSIFYMLVLVWQTYYALFTVRQNHWGTR
jgi:hyaluronan synthase